MEKKIELLEKTLKTYLDINNYILKNFQLGAMNYQTIESLKNINLNLPNEYDLFINATGEKESFTILMTLFDYQNIENKSFISKDANKVYASNKIKLPKSLNKSIEEKIDNKITCLCQIKKGIAVGDDKGQIHCYTLYPKQLKKLLTIPDGKNSINYLNPLRSGYFICSSKNEFKIYELYDTKEKIQYKIIQTFKYKNLPDMDIDIDIERKVRNSNISNKSNKSNKTNKKNNNINNNIVNNNDIVNFVLINQYKYQILELINGYLIYIDGDTLIVLKPASRGNYIEKPIKEIKFNSNIISISELNNNKFCLYCGDKNLIIYDSNNFKEKTRITSLSKYKNIEKISGVNDDIIAAFDEKKIILIGEAQQNVIQEYKIDESNIYDICTQLNKIFVASQSSFIQFNVAVNKEGKYLTKSNELPIKFIVNRLYIVKFTNNKGNKDERIVCVYNDNIIKVL